MALPIAQHAIDLASTNGRVVGVVWVSKPDLQFACGKHLDNAGGPTRCSCADV
jgi:hypothetical protein